jgi:hypothetical protein
MSYIIYLFYKYYSKGATKLIPYQKSVFAFLTLIFINFFSIGVLISKNIFNGLSFSSRIQSYIFYSIILIITYFVINKFVPEKAIKEYETDKNTKLHSWFLLFYVIISITLMLVVLIKLRHK